MIVHKVTQDEFDRQMKENWHWNWENEDAVRRFIDWARAHKAVLNQAHKDIADKFGIPTDGIIFSGPIPIG